MSRVATLRRQPTETRQRIEEAAVRLFAEKGYDGTSTRDIAGAVGVTEGALYRHFPSKEAIAREVFLTRYRLLAGEIRRVTEEGAGFTPAIERLVAFLFRMMAEDRAGFTFVLLTQHSHLRYIPDDPEINVVAALVAFFSAAMARGDIRAGDPQLAAAMALGMVLQPAIFHLYDRLPAPDEAARDAIVRAMLQALA